MNASRTKIQLHWNSYQRHNLVDWQNKSEVTKSAPLPVFPSHWSENGELTVVFLSLLQLVMAAFPVPGALIAQWSPGHSNSGRMEILREAHTSNPRLSLYWPIIDRFLRNQAILSQCKAVPDSANSGLIMSGSISPGFIDSVWLAVKRWPQPEYKCISLTSSSVKGVSPEGVLILMCKGSLIVPLNCSYLRTQYQL